MPSSPGPRTILSSRISAIYDPFDISSWVSLIVSLKRVETAVSILAKIELVSSPI